ncbi:hypothetical protein [Tumebacillus flagellatus]|uniref:Zinc finger CHC2-type domain-containing protein n=1 Tax=Tumebacillus flagellatus TaxID=1157490 RepID=A0A074LNC1_9BACL|nr:hypothetical protein [Tumebacillus flagellatus]KEO82010.1 hypothetical protein EL26_17730 [Tumebacillus flagellatus]
MFEGEYERDKETGANNISCLFSIVGTNIHLIENKNVGNLQQFIDLKDIEVLSHSKVYEYLKQQDLRQLLGVYKRRFNCFFHEDSATSATIFLNQETGHYLYHCDDHNCPFRDGTIIEVVARILDSENADALRFLRKIYRISYKETDWQRTQREMIEENITLIWGKELEIQYPLLYNMIVRYLKLLQSVLDKAIEHVYTEYFTTTEGTEIVFFASARHFAGKNKKDVKLITNRINFLTYLGLINKLRDEEIPEKMLQQSYAEKAKKNQYYRITFYSVPRYDSELLNLAEQRAKTFKEKKMTIKGFSREMLLRALGVDEADRVFPQQKGKPIREINEHVAFRLEQIILTIIDEKGWTREKEVLEQARIDGIRNQFKELELKRIIPEMLDKYALSKEKLNKKLKGKFGILEDGYFEVIYREYSE